MKIEDMNMFEKITKEFFNLKSELSEKYAISYDDVEDKINEYNEYIEKIIHESIAPSDYKRIGNTAVHIVPADDGKRYMVMVYDSKQYMWRNADIYADTVEDCISIANIVFGGDYIDDNDLQISIDYGDDEQSSEHDDLIF